jgi:MFS transporter, ACS family, glucarate transporter
VTASAAPATSVRWWTLIGLSGITFVSYLERTNISVAAEMMIPALGITKVQMGQIFTSFLIGYAVFQIPGGFLGDKLGARATLAASALVWGIATILTGLLPALLGGSLLAILVGLWLVRFFLGIGEATTFPVGNRAVRNWMPPSERAFGTSIMILGTCTASAVSSPLVSWLMLRFGWRMSFYLTSIPALLMAILWYRFSRDTPQTHAGVNAAELAHIGSRDEPLIQPEGGTFLSLLRQRNVLLLVVSYMSEGYVLFIFVFWLYIYLVEKRGFSIIRGGWVATLPWLTAILLTPLGGLASDRLGAKYGRLRGARVVIMTGYGLSGLLLFLAAYSAVAWVCVASLSLSIAFLMSAESSFWASATHLGGASVATLSGVMNAAGVLGGIVSTSLVPVLVDHFGWLTAFASGTFMGLFCVFVWITIREPG